MDYRIAGITWNCWRKEKFCCIFELFSGTMISCHTEAFLSLSVAWANSQLRSGWEGGAWEVCVGNLWWRRERFVCRPRKNGLDSEISLHCRVWRGKSSTKKLPFEFLHIKSIFSCFVVGFIFGGLGALFVFFNCFLKAARPQCCDPGHPCDGIKKPQNTTKSPRVCLVLLQDAHFSIDKADIFVI